MREGKGWKAEENSTEKKRGAGLWVGRAKKKHNQIRRLMFGEIIGIVGGGKQAISLEADVRIH